MTKQITFFIRKVKGGKPTPRVMKNVAVNYLQPSEIDMIIIFLPLDLMIFLSKYTLL